MQMRDGLSSREQHPSNLETRGAPVRVENARAAVCSFSREGQFRPCVTGAGAPSNQLSDVLRAFIDKQFHQFRAAQPVSLLESFLLMQSDRVLVAERSCDASPRPPRCRIGQVGLCQNEYAPGVAQFDGCPEASHATAHYDVIGARTIAGGLHGTVRRAACVW